MARIDKEPLEAFGNFFKKMRKGTDLTLRQFCKDNEFDPGNLSKLERGLATPPQSHDILEKYAKALNIQKNSDDWYTFFDLASACSGRIPPDVMSDADLVKKLPLVFRTLRGQQIDEEKLDELADVIRKS